MPRLHTVIHHLIPHIAFRVALVLLVGWVGDAAADQLDSWCPQAKLPSSIAICSDPELRALAIERQHAFNDARARIGEAKASVLLADQNAWVALYPKACGLASDTPPSLPLSSPLKDCMARAGRARIAYLRAYGASPASSGPTGATPAEARVGPGFDCGKAAAPLAQMICANPDLSKLDLRFNQAYYALRQQLDPAGQRQLQKEDSDFIKSVLLACGVPETGSVAGSSDCVAAQYSKKRSEWMVRLSGPAYEEAKRPIEEHIALQASLQQIGFLPAATKIDGLYSAATRSAISEWQTASGRPATGIMSDADAAVFRQGSAPRVATALSPPSSERSLPPGTADLAGGEVQLKQRNGIYRVPVRVNDAITLDFALDSGAADVQIPADVAMTLFRTETLTENDFTGTANYILADGSKLPSARFVLRELKVGDHRLLKVPASVGPATGELLLGQSFLSRFNSWTIDNARHVLVLAEQASRDPRTSPNAPATSQPAPLGSQ
jgi:uncharacterized protein/predicted aspartyl protease